MTMKIKTVNDELLRAAFGAPDDTPIVFATPDSKWMKQRYEIKPCKKCKIIPRIGYACGEYFLVGTDGCDICDGFKEMHSSAEQEIEVWNNLQEVAECHQMK